MAQVRYFAAAAEQAGLAEEQVQASTVGQLHESLTQAHGAGFAHVLAQCSVLVDGSATTDPTTLLPPHATIDILPPFAGG